jgi:hypothetical protein
LPIVAVLTHACMFVYMLALVHGLITTDTQHSTSHDIIDYQ